MKAPSGARSTFCARTAEECLDSVPIHEKGGAVFSDRVLCISHALLVALAVVLPLVISPISYDSFVLPKRVLFQVGTLVLAGIWLISPLPFFPPKRDPLLWPIGLFLAWCSVSIFLGFHSLRQVRDFSYPVLGAVFWMISRRPWSDPGRRFAVMRWLHVPVFIVACYAVFQDYGIDFIYPVGGVHDWRARITSTMGNPNFVAGYLAILFPGLVALACTRSVSPRWFWFVGLPVVALCVAVFVVTFCVGAFVALLAAILTGCFFATVRRSFARFSGKRLLIFLAAGAMIVLFYCTDNPYNGRVGSVIDQALASPQWRTGFAARRFNWRTTWLMIENRPLRGIGFANFQAFSMRYQGENYARQGRPHGSPIVKLVDQPHHQLLETAAETGPLGVFLLLWLLASVVKSSLRTIRLASQEDACIQAGAFLGFMTAVYHALSSFPFHLPASILATLIWLSMLLPPSREELDRRVSRPFRPVFGMILLAVFAAPLLLPYVSNIYLRRGYEAGPYGIRDLELAAVLDPLEPMNHFMLGHSYYVAGKLEAAANAYLDGLALQDDLQAHLALRDIFANLGATEALLVEQQEIIRLNPGYIPYHEQLENMYKQLGMEERSKQVREKINTLSGSQ